MSDTCNDVLSVDLAARILLDELKGETTLDEVTLGAIGGLERALRHTGSKWASEETRG